MAESETMATTDLENPLSLPPDLAPYLEAVRPTYLPTSRPTCRPTSRPGGCPPDLPPVQAPGRTDGRTGVRTDGQPANSLSQLSPSEIYWLNDRQALVLLLLMEDPSGIASYQNISLMTGIPPESVRKITTLLLKEGFLEKRRQYRKGLFQGIQYEINRTKCRIFFSARGTSFAALLPVRTGDRTGVRTVDQTDDRPTCRPNPSSSSQSSTSKKSLTAINREEPQSPINWEEVLENDMDLRFWRRNGLRASIVQAWITKYQIKPALMLESLKHADFDLRKRKKEAQEKKTKGDNDWDAKLVKKPID